MTDGFRAIAVALLALLCCAGLPLLLAAGVTVGAVTWVGGFAVGAALLAAAIAVIVLRAR